MTLPFATQLGFASPKVSNRMAPVQPPGFWVRRCQVFGRDPVDCPVIFAALPWKDYVKHPWKPRKHLYNLHIQLLYGAIFHRNCWWITRASFLRIAQSGMRGWKSGGEVNKPDRRFASCDLRSLVWRNALQVWRSLTCGKCRFLNADVDSQLI